MQNPCELYFSAWVPRDSTGAGGTGDREGRSQTEPRAAPRRMAAKRPQGRRSRRWPLMRRNRRLASTLTADCLAQSAEATAGASADASAAGAGMPASPVVSPAPEPAPGVYSDGGPSGVSTGAAAHTTRDSVHSRHQSQPRLGATFLRLSGDTSGFATEDAAVIAILSPGAAAPLPIGCRPTTCCQSPKAAARTCSTYNYPALPSQLAPRPWVGCAAGMPHVATPPRCWRTRSTRSPTACRWTWPGGTPFVSPRAERASSLSHRQTLAVVHRLRTSRFRRSARSAAAATIRSAALLAQRL